MGFGTIDNTRKTYVNIVGGKLAVSAKEGDLNAVSRKNKNDKIVWEIYHPNLTGIITHINVQKNEKLGAWEYTIEVTDVIDKYIVSVPADSKYGDNLACKVPNIKMNVETTITPYDFEDKVEKNSAGKYRKHTGITFVQNGIKIPVAITKENPQGRPEPGADKMDEEEYKIYMIRVRKFYRELVEKTAFDNESKPKNTNNNTVKSNPDNEDLPF